MDKLTWEEQEALKQLVAELDISPDFDDNSVPTPTANTHPTAPPSTYAQNSSQQMNDATSITAPPPLSTNITAANTYSTASPGLNIADFSMPMTGADFTAPPFGAPPASNTSSFPAWIGNTPLTPPPGWEISEGLWGSPESTSQMKPLDGRNQNQTLQSE